MPLAPIILFVYNRPDMVKSTLLSLKRNNLAQQSELYIYSDGPKNGATSDQLNKIKEVREIIKQEQWCGKVIIIEREMNKGLASSVIEGVTEIVNKFGKVIVIEDDVELSMFFLNFMNDALDIYENNHNILSIGSWNYFASNEVYNKNHFLFRYPDSIAWATFKRSWDLFEQDARVAYEKLKSLNKLNSFNGDGEAMYFENMLQMQIDQKINSWAIRWTATAVINDKLTVLPAITMSKHLGFGAEATHEKSEVDYNSHLVVCESVLKITELKESVENQFALIKWIDFVKKNFLVKPNDKLTLAHRIKRRIKHIFKFSV